MNDMTNQQTRIYWIKMISPIFHSVHNLSDSEVISRLTAYGLTYATEAVAAYHEDEIGPRWFEAMRDCRQIAKAAGEHLAY